MKLNIIKLLLFWIIIAKNIFNKNSIASNDDFQLTFSDKFMRNFKNQDKFSKFKKNLMKKLKFRMREKFSKNFIMMDLLQIKEKEKMKNNLRYRKEKMQKLKNILKTENSTNLENNLLVKDSNKTKMNKEKNLNNEFEIKNNSISYNFNESIEENSNIHFSNNNKTIGNSSPFIIDSKKSNFKELSQNELSNQKIKKNELYPGNVFSSQKSSEYFTENLEHKKSNKTLTAIDANNHNIRESGKKLAKRKKTNTNLDVFDWSFGDINSSKRVTKFYINLQTKCSIFINDTIYYDKDEYTANFIDHLILHNNFDNIEPRSVYSHDVLINYFIYNKKLNMFTVNFENEQHRNYSIVYEYFANNIIKMQQNKKDYYSNNEKNVNEFLWKFYNENTNSKNLSLEVEFYFTIDKNFMNENVEFNNKMYMYKTVIDSKDTLVFKWNGTLLPYEVKVFESVFPMIFENCQTMTVNFTMILIGAFFVIFVVLILYLLFSSIAKDLN